MARFGLIGRSLTHSFSQHFFTRKFEQEGMPEHRYDLFELERVEDWASLRASMPDLKGVNVTIPYKRSIIPLLDELDPVAAAIGAVNTIRINGGRCAGFNTDVIGFRATLLPLLGTSRPRALVLGSGGASRAVVYVLRELGMKFRVVSRSPENGDLVWDQLDPSLVGACPLIINTTPLGMHPEVEGMPPLPINAIGPKHLLIDLVYNPATTRLMAEVGTRSARVVNGLTMLHAQAESSWAIWNGAQE